MRRRRSGTVVMACAIMLAACSASDIRVDSGIVGGTTDGGQRRAPSTDADPDEVVEAALRDLDELWTEWMPAIYGRDFWPPSGGFVAYGPDSAVPQCGDHPLRYQDIEANALYCPEEDLIAWDRVNLVPSLQEDFGPLTVGMVMAHEYAHAVQARAGVRGAVVTLELQADCFAGAWVADVDERNDLFSTAGGGLDQAVGGLLELRDSVGVTAGDPNAHGSGFDRVSAFQDGFDRGPEACISYEEDPPKVVALPFRSVADRSQSGNLPVEELLGPLVTDLESFYTALLEDEGLDWEPLAGLEPVDPSTDAVDCGTQELTGDELGMASFYCVPDDTIYLDAAGLVPALDEIGDFAVGGEIARQYAFAAQHQLGVLDRYTDTDLHADCLTGVYASAQFLESIPEQELFLSPGDLDEIIIAFLAFGSDADATAFDRTAAFRSCFVDGYDTCADMLVR